MTANEYNTSDTAQATNSTADSAESQPASPAQGSNEPIKRMSLWDRIGANICRAILGIVFVLSGYVKAVDPLGTQYKLQDYLKALHLEALVPDWMTLTASIALSAIEFSLGIFILFAIRRRLVSKITVLFMLVMTLITLWLVIANPVSDCGCFGDALVLTNTQSLAKNVALLTLSWSLATRPLAMYRFISRTNQWIAINFTILFTVITSIYCLYKLPLFDFRPYHIGANILKSMEIPEGAEQPQFETTFIMEKNGERKEFTLAEYPDSTWTFIDSKTVQTKEGYVPPIHDFSIQQADGDDITEEVLTRKGYTFLLISPHLSSADDTNFGQIDQINEYAQAENVPFYCLTASTEEEISHWEDITGAEYPFCLTDETTLKTIIRSNPGLLLLKDGTIIRKWSHNALPTMDELQGPLDKTEVGQLPNDSVGKTILKIVAWFFLPLLLLTLADRTWAWSQYLRRKTRIARQQSRQDA